MAGSEAGRRKRKYYPRNRTDMLDFYGVNNLSEVNRARRVNGMSEIVPKERKCLRCEKEFMSEDNGHRMCTLCRTVTRGWD